MILFFHVQKGLFTDSYLAFKCTRKLTENEIGNIHIQIVKILRSKDKDQEVVNQIRECREKYGLEKVDIWNSDDLRFFRAN